MLPDSKIKVAMASEPSLAKWLLPRYKYFIFLFLTRLLQSLAI